MLKRPHLNGKKLSVVVLTVIPAIAGSIKNSNHGPCQPGQKAQNNQNDQSKVVWRCGSRVR
jgi:hypothetical protein